eukprot:986751-Prymnesium_polylepis.1
MDAGGWSPLNKVYMGNSVMTGGGAFGAQYVFNHNQATYYTAEDPPYTEFIEVAIATPVYVVQIEVGSARGMGQIVSMKVKDVAGSWVSLYSGAALTKDAETYSRTSKYWRWAPDVCRTQFVASELRIEVDTSAETGIEDWNYIDYVKVFGSTGLQAAAIPKGTSKLVYVPDEHAFGADTIEYQASDCPGNLFHQSDAGTVAVTITAVNDAPAARDSFFTMFTNEKASVLLDFDD